MKLSIVIPLYNERQIIKININKIYNYFINKFNFEILVVNDGSNDDSMEILKNIKIKNLKIINIKKNLGKGNAIKNGVLNSKGDIVLITDADLSAPINQFDNLYQHYLKGYDIVIGSRSVKNSIITKRQNLIRVLAGKIFNYCVKYILGLNFQDTQCGFKLFHGNHIRELIKHTIIKGFSIDVEILFLAKKIKLIIKETGVEWANDKISSVNIFRDSIRMFIDLINIKFNNYKF